VATRSIIRNRSFYTFISSHSPFVVLEACLNDKDTKVLHFGKDGKVEALRCCDVMNGIPGIDEVSGELLEEVSSNEAC
jgi:hypothetical protein